MTTVIDIKGISNYLSGQWVHEDLNLQIQSQEILAIVGGSGSGKTTLLRSILGLTRPTRGSIKIQEQEILHLSPKKLQEIRRNLGMMFQKGALFGSFTVLENIAFPLQLHTSLSDPLIQEIAALKLALVGLPVQSGALYPNQLSGGMLKRAAVARAIALDPPILFLDEPTAGLDPISASSMDSLIRSLRDTLQLTVVLVTHDLDTLWSVCDRVAFLGLGKVQMVGTMTEVNASENPVIREYFASPRARAARDMAMLEDQTQHGE
jgi:phospholipid/cholesterol/gamma-HCH transport system ATP-binding protein